MNKTTSDTSRMGYLCSLMYLLSLVTYTIAQFRGVMIASEKALSGYPTGPFGTESEWFHILKAIGLPSDIMGYTLITEAVVSIIVVCCIFLVVQYLNYKNNNLSTKSFLKDLAIFAGIYVVLGLLAIFLNYMQII